MLIKKKSDRTFEPVVGEGIQKAEIHWAIVGTEGAPNFAMRIVRIGAGGIIPLHTHDYEHEVYVIKGRGEALGKFGNVPFDKGDVIYVEPGEVHGFKNTGTKTTEFV
jgi:quercetin dioxygenase-like cupin family protein